MPLAWDYACPMLARRLLAWPRRLFYRDQGRPYSQAGAATPEATAIPDPLGLLVVRPDARRTSPQGLAMTCRFMPRHRCMPE